MRKKWILDEEEKLKHLTNNLRSIQKLMNQVDNPNLESYRFLGHKQAEMMRERDQQFVKLLRIYNEHPQLSVTVRCFTFLYGVRDRILDRFKSRVYSRKG